MLAWRDVDDAGESAADGYNVVIHEFAHVIDMRGGVTDGVRQLPTRRASAGAGCDALADEYERFAERVDADEETFLDPYGAEALEEFFAVAAEAFFVAPQATRGGAAARSTSCSREFFRQDPARRRPERRRGPRGPRCPVARSDAQAVAGSAFGLSLFLRRLDVEQRLALGVDVDRQAAAVDQAAEQQLVGQRAADRVLDQALHRPRAHQRIEALLGQVLAQAVGEGDLDLLLGQLALRAAAGTCRPRAG